MFDKVKKQLSAVEESKDFLNVLKESVGEELGDSDSGLLLDEEELLVDPDSIDEEDLKKVMAAVDGCDDEEDIDNILLDVMSDGDGDTDDDDTEE